VNGCAYFDKIWDWLSDGLFVVSCWLLITNLCESIEKDIARIAFHTKSDHRPDFPLSDECKHCKALSGDLCFYKSVTSVKFRDEESQLNWFSTVSFHINVTKTISNRSGGNFCSKLSLFFYSEK
jgi:hypothetical protein